MNTTLNDITDCTSGVPDKIKSNPNITGDGVFLSFIITSVASIIFSFIIIWMEFYRKSGSVIRKMLLSLSDQQIITGIGSMMLGLMKMKELTFYQFHAIWMFSLLSTVTHANTLVALAKEIKSDWVILWFRQIVIFANFLLSIAFGVIIIKIQHFEKDNPTVSIFCLLHPPKYPPDQVMTVSLDIDLPKIEPYESAFYTKFSIAFNITIFIISLGYLRFKFGLKGHYRALLSKLFCHLMFTVVAIIATYSILADISHYKDTDLVIDENKGIWEFGEVLALLLLILPVISAMENYREVKAQENKVEIEAAVTL